MALTFVDTLDGMLAMAASATGDAFARRQADFVLTRLQADGGFAGRAGGSDLYYTDFALRVLAACAPEAMPATSAAYLAAQQPADIIDCLDLLYARRALGGDAGVDESAIRRVLADHAVPEGGYRRAGIPGISSYHTFLAMLCWEMLDTPMPHADAAAHALVALAVGGGYTEHAGEGRAQTSATAGAVPVLSWQGMLTETAKTDAVTFLADMQAPDGGLRAHAEAREGDLLSTFTGALTLFALDGMDRLNVSALARFARQCIVPGGGFKACPDDVEADVEYTYYGLGTLGVLQAYVLARS